MGENIWKYNKDAFSYYYNKYPYDYGYIDEQSIEKEKDELSKAIEIVLASPDSIKKLYDCMELTKKKLIMELILNDSKLL